MRGEKRWDKHGPMIEMARADGYVLIRRPSAFPLVMSIDTWNLLAQQPLSSRTNRKKATA